MALVNGGFLHYMDMKKFLKNLLLRNRWSDFEIILQECSLGDPFQKVFAKFWSAQKHGSDEQGLLTLYRDIKKFLKNLLLRNCCSDFEIISQKYSLSDPFQKLFAKFWSVYKYGSDEWGLFALYGHEEILKNFFLQNRLSDFEIISQECSMGDPFQKLFAKFWSVYKYGSGERGLFAQHRHEEIYVCIVQKNLVLRKHWSDFEIIS